MYGDDVFSPPQFVFSRGDTFRPRSKGQRAFSLIEVAIAVAVVGFAFVPLFGLLPVGLNSFHQAIDATVGSQIAQRVINDDLQTDFTVLTGTSTQPFVQTPLRYFDGQGDELPSSTSAIFQVQTRITPATATPNSASQPANANLATVAVQVADNPGNRVILSGTDLLWNDPTVPATTYTAIVVRNQ